MSWVKGNESPHDSVRGRGHLGPLVQGKPPVPPSPHRELWAEATFGKGMGLLIGLGRGSPTAGAPWPSGGWRRPTQEALG